MIWAFYYPRVKEHPGQHHDGPVPQGVFADSSEFHVSGLVRVRKISRSDFRKDFEKEHKHKLLLARKATKTYSKCVRGKKTDETETYVLIPNYFTYLVPEGLVKVEEVPEYAGLLYVLSDYKGSTGRRNHHLSCTTTGWTIRCCAR
jgi:hypothetical protein